MIEPSKVKEAFKKVEKENYDFRVYLKINADMGRLDEQFLRLHNEFFETYDCNQCRNCCRKYGASFNKNEVIQGAKYFNITEKEFVQRYLSEKDGKFFTEKGSCCFIMEDGACEIESSQPYNCKEYPYTHRPERLFSLLSIVEQTSVCPVVFEIFERLKIEYRFKKKR